MSETKKLVIGVALFAVSITLTGTTYVVEDHFTAAIIGGGGVTAAVVGLIVLLWPR